MEDEFFILELLLFMLFEYIGQFPIFHAAIFPLYVLSFPLGFFLFQQQNVVYFGPYWISKKFIYFWTIPSTLVFIYFLLYFVLERTPTLQETDPLEIKPQEIKWALTYFIRKKYNHTSVCSTILTSLYYFVLIFTFTFLYSLPLAPLMMLQGEDINE